MNKLIQKPGIEVMSIKVVHSRMGKLVNVVYMENGELCETFYETSI